MSKNRHRKKGDKKMNQEKEQITIRLPITLKEKVHKEASTKGISFNELVVIALWKYLDEWK